MISTDRKVTAWDIETARRVYANAVLGNLDQQTIGHAREWLQWLIEMARRQQ